MNTVGMQCDQTVILQGFYPHKDYPEKLRRVRFFDVETGIRIVLITNDFALPALTLAELYRSYPRLKQKRRRISSLRLQ